MCVFDTLGSSVLSGIIRQSQFDNLYHARCLTLRSGLAVGKIYATSFSQRIEIFYTATVMRLSSPNSRIGVAHLK